MLDLNDTITMAGLVATTPRSIVTEDGTMYTSFRLVAPQQSGHSNWYTVTVSGQLALNMEKSVKKGDRVIVMGSVIIKEWSDDHSSGSSIEVIATTIGHDIRMGSSKFQRITEKGE